MKRGSGARLVSLRIFFLFSFILIPLISAHRHRVNSILIKKSTSRQTWQRKKQENENLAKTDNLLDLGVENLT